MRHIKFLSKSIRGVVWVFLVISLNACGHLVPQTEQEIQPLYQAAVKQHKAGQLDAALALYSQIIEQDPEHVQAYQQRLKIFYQQKNYLATVADNKTLIELQPYDDSWYGNLSWSLILLQRPVQARGYAQKAHELAPLSFSWLVNLGHTYLLSGDNATAKRYYRQSIALLTTEKQLQKGAIADFDVFVDKGWQVDNVTQMKTWAQQVFVEYKPHRQAFKLMNQSVAKSKKRNYREAASLIQQAIALRETIQADNLLIARTYYRLGNVCQVMRAYDKAEPAYQQALDLQLKEQNEQHLDVTKVYYSQAILYARTQRYAQAEKQYHKVLVEYRTKLGDAHNRTLSTRQRLSDLYLATKRYALAEQQYLGLLADLDLLVKQQTNTTLVVLKNIIQLYTKTSKPQQAIAYAERRLALQKKLNTNKPLATTPAMNQLANLYLDVGQHKKAIDLYQAALNIQQEVLGQDHILVSTTLNDFADLYFQLGDYSQAEALHKKALAIRQAKFPSDHLWVGKSLHNLGLVYRAQSRYMEAEPLLQEAVAIYENKRGHDYIELTVFLHNLAGLYYDVGNYTRAEKLFLRTLALKRKHFGNAHLELAPTLNQLGLVYKDMGDYDKAERYYQQSFAIRKTKLGPQHPQTATSLGNLAGLYSAKGQYKQAEPILINVVEVHRQYYGAKSVLTAVPMSNLAVFYREVGLYPKAEALYREVLQIREAALNPHHVDIAITLNNMAVLYNHIGAHHKSERLLQRSLAIYQKRYGNQHPLVATALGNLAFFYAESEQPAKAEPLYQQVLAIRQQRLGKRHRDVALALNNMAVFYHDLGSYARAERFYRKALAIYRQTLSDDHPDIATLSSSMADLYRDRGEFSKAKPLFEKAVQVHTRVWGADHPDTARSMNNLGLLYRDLRHYEQAIALFKQALIVYQQRYGEQHIATARGLNNLSVTYRLQGKHLEAERLAVRALSIAVAQPNALLSFIYFNLAQIKMETGHAAEAIFYAKQAVNVLQQLRTGLLEMDKEIQEDFLRHNRWLYKVLAGWLIDTGRLPEAEQVLAMLKEAEYFNFIRRSAAQTTDTTKTTFNAVEQTQYQQLQTIVQPFAQLRRELNDLQRIKIEFRTDEQQQRIAELQQDIAQRQQQYLAFIEQNQSVFTQPNKAVANNAGAFDTNRYQALLAGLGPDVALVHFLQLEDGLRILLRTANSNIAKRVAVTEKQLNTATHVLRKNIKRVDRNPKQAAKKLYQWLISPIEKHLTQAGITTLMLYKHGTLRYIPLSALHDGKQFLVERYAISNYTAAAIHALQSKPNDDWHVVGMGVSKEIKPFSPLHMVPQELENIIQRDKQDPNGVFRGKIYVDEAFTQQRFKASLAGEYNAGHIATHYVFKPGTESDSFLLMGDGSQLALATLRTEQYDFSAIDLLTLSACDTAVHDQNANGQEVEGLATLVQRQGAKGVMATLWAVADCSTGVFMQQFYQYRQQGLNKAEAIRQSQLDFIQGRIQVLAVSPNHPEQGCQPVAGDLNHLYQHPYYWAPFILMGNWQ